MRLLRAPRSPLAARRTGMATITLDFHGDALLDFSTIGRAILDLSEAHVITGVSAPPFRGRPWDFAVGSQSTLLVMALTTIAE